MFAVYLFHNMIFSKNVISLIILISDYHHTYSLLVSRRFYILMFRKRGNVSECSGHFIWRELKTCPPLSTLTRALSQLCNLFFLFAVTVKRPTFFVLKASVAWNKLFYRVVERSAFSLTSDLRSWTISLQK